MTFDGSSIDVSGEPERMVCGAIISAGQGGNWGEGRSAKGIHQSPHRFALASVVAGARQVAARRSVASGTCLGYGLRPDRAANARRNVLRRRIMQATLCQTQFRGVRGWMRALHDAFDPYRTCGLAASAPNTLQRMTIRGG
ncbi:MAG: hypothetical protein AAF771_15035 [Pseudomonadota bacterium]